MPNQMLKEIQERLRKAKGGPLTREFRPSDCAVTRRIVPATPQARFQNLRKIAHFVRVHPEEFRKLKPGESLIMSSL